MTCSCCEKCVLTQRQKREKPVISPPLEPSKKRKCIIWKQVYCRPSNDDKHELQEKRFHNHRETSHRFNKNLMFSTNVHSMDMTALMFCMIKSINLWKSWNTFKSRQNKYDFPILGNFHINSLFN